MFTKKFLFGVKDPVWQRITSFSIIIFFILLGDAFLSYWIPNFLQDNLGSSLLMGLVMSFSSLVGFGADVIFPQILKGATVRKLLLSSIIASFAFIGANFLGVAMPKMWVFLVAMAVWGIYYEYLGFATQQFVADSVPMTLRSSGWAIIGIFKNLAYLLGPLLAGLILLRGNYVFLISTTILVSIALIVLAISKKGHERVMAIEVSEVNVWRELSHWKVLFKSTWPIIILSLFMGIIDATFWTTGAVWMERLSGESFWGVLFLPAYQLPSLFMGLIVARMGIFRGKKKMAEKYLMISGLILCLFWFKLPIFVIPVIVFASSIFLALAYPLVEAIYSDVTARMGVERKHMIGLASSTASLAYIVGPSMSGFIANTVGEQMTFVVVGGTAAVISLLLLAVTPKKLHLPQTEIVKWDD